MKFIRPDEWEAEAMRLAFDFAESYGVLADITHEKADALLAHLQTRRSDEAAAIAAERARIIGLLHGIDRYENEDPDGWWETTTGADFGASVLAKIQSGEAK